MAPKGKPLRCASWNARSLLAKKPKSRRRKLSYLQELLTAHGVVCSQEARGTWSELRTLFAAYRKAWRIFYVRHAEENTGGLLMFLRRAAWPDRAQYDLRSLVDGRVGRLTITFGSRQWMLWSVRNFGVAAAEMGRVADRLRADMSECHEHPF